MINKSVPFIGRDKELSDILNLIFKWDSLIFFALEAGGGIGKTRLLDELEIRINKSPNKYIDDIDSYIITPIIDFDDHRYIDKNYIWRDLATHLGESEFNEFFELDEECAVMENAVLKHDTKTDI